MKIITESGTYRHFEEELFVDRLMEKFVGMEVAVAILFMAGYDEVWITKHFEISRARVNELKMRMRKKAINLATYMPKSMT